MQTADCVPTPTTPTTLQPPPSYMCYPKCIQHSIEMQMQRTCRVQHLGHSSLGHDSGSTPYTYQSASRIVSLTRLKCRRTAHAQVKAVHVTRTREHVDRPHRQTHTSHITCHNKLQIRSRIEPQCDCIAQWVPGSPSGLLTRRSIQSRRWVPNSCPHGD
jgi:hypothetical protein